MKKIPENSRKKFHYKLDKQTFIMIIGIALVIASLIWGFIWEVIWTPEIGASDTYIYGGVVIVAALLFGIYLIFTLGLGLKKS